MRKKILSLMLTLAMVLTMVPFLPAAVYAADAPQIEIEGITPVAGEEMATASDVKNHSSEKYTLLSLEWLDAYSKPVSGKFQPGEGYIAVLKFKGDTELTEEDCWIKIDGNTFYYDEDALDTEVDGDTIEFRCYFYDIEVPYYAISLEEGFPGNVIETADPARVFKMKKYNGTKTVYYKWWKCDKDGNTSGDPILSNTTGKFTMSKFGWNHGLHYVAVKAKDANGNWSNKVVLKLKIHYDLNDAKITVKNRTYNGKSGRMPSVTIKAKINGVTKTLKKGTDYTITYKKAASKRKSVGIYSFMIDGRGYYFYSYDDETDGDFDYYDRTFKINPKGTSLGTITPGSKKLTVKWKKQSAKMAKSRITGYQVQVATDKNFTKGKKLYKVKGYSKLTKTFKNLKGGKKYYVRVRTYKVVDGSTYYSKWSKVKSAVTKK